MKATIYIAIAMALIPMVISIDTDSSLCGEFSWIIFFSLYYDEDLWAIAQLNAVVFFRAISIKTEVDEKKIRCIRCNCSYIFNLFVMRLRHQLLQEAM